MKLVTVEEMRRIDVLAGEMYQIPSRILMENAGSAILQEIKKYYGSALAGKRFAVICGIGNNGGDGFVVARRLAVLGADVRLFTLGQKNRYSEDTMANFEICKAMELEINNIQNEGDLRFLKVALLNCDVVIDAILGTGFSGTLKPLLKEVVDIINEFPLDRIAIDVPSGLDANFGKYETAIIANLTITLGVAKLGMFTSEAEEVCGKIVVGDISIPKQLKDEFGKNKAYVTKNFAKRYLPKRSGNVHKGDFGKIVVLGGNDNMWGAPILAGKGAVAGGAGLVYMATNKRMQGVIASVLPEAMTIPLPAEVDDLADKILVFGIGLGRNEQTSGRIYEGIMPILPERAVIDADALWFLAQDGRQLLKTQVITPHEMEAARLLDIEVEEVRANRIVAAQMLAEKYNCVAVLKGERSIIADADGNIFINSSGNAGMATGGAGDVLAGLIGSMLGTGISSTLATVLAVYIHGLAGDIVAEKVGRYSLKASDIAENIGEAILKIAGE